MVIPCSAVIHSELKIAQLTPDKILCTEIDSIISCYLSLSKTLTKVSKEWKMRPLVQDLSECIG